MSLSKTLYSLLEDLPDITEKLLTGTYRIKTNKILENHGSVFYEGHPINRGNFLIM